MGQRVPYKFSRSADGVAARHAIETEDKEESPRRRDASSPERRFLPGMPEREEKGGTVYTLSSKMRRGHRLIDLDIDLLVEDGFVAESKIESGVEGSCPACDRRIRENRPGYFMTLEESKARIFLEQNEDLLGKLNGGKAG
jgi:hypothetical protein